MLACSTGGGPSASAETPLPLQTPAPRNSAELPRVFVDTTMPVQTGKVRKVTECSELQPAIRAAEYGDTIEIDARLTCVGQFTLPEKTTGSGWILIETSAIANLPLEGTRINPTIHSAFMPKILTNTGNGHALRALARAHHYRLIGIEFGQTVGISTTDAILLLDSGASALTDYAKFLVVDRCYVHGNPASTARRGIGIGGNYIAVVDSYISDMKDSGSDTQAVGGWNFQGPLKIVNNFLEAAGENIVFGGSAPVVEGVVPSDIEIRGNHLYKPLRWRPGNPEFAGARWLVKNSFEVKSGQRILFEGNVVENNWAGGQAGFMVMLTPAYQSNQVPQAVVQDITIRYNVFAHSGGWINSNYTSPGDNSSGPATPPDVVCTPGQVPVGCLRARRWNIHDNLVEDIFGAKWGGEGRALQILGPTDDITFAHNTVFQDGAMIMFGSPGPARNPNRITQRFIFRDNLINHGRQGVTGAGTPDAMATLEFHAPGHVFRGNVIVGDSVGAYPGKNSFAGDWKKVKFVNGEGANFCLAPDSKFRKAGTDGKDIGADFDAIEKATAGVVATGKPPGQ